MSLFEDIEEMAKDEASIFTYQLVDGSYIMAEEVDYDFEQNTIFIINPVRIRESIKGDKFQLSTYMITEHSTNAIILLHYSLIPKMFTLKFMR